MSVELRTKLAALMPFIATPSYARQIKAIEDRLAEDVDVSQLDFEEVNAAQDKVIESKADVQLGLSWRSYYVGGPLGDNANNGETELTPCATFAELVKKMDLSKYSRIYMLGDIEETQTIFQHNGNAQFDVRMDGHSLTFKDGGRWAFGGSVNLRFFDGTVKNDRNHSSSAIAVSMSGGVRFIGCEIEMTDGAVAAGSDMFNLSPFVTFDRSNTFTDDNAFANLIVEPKDTDFASRAVVTG